MIQLNKYCTYRREHFGGLMVNANAFVFFINGRALESLEKGQTDETLRQYLVNIDMLPGEKKPLETSDIQLENFEFDEDCLYLSAPITAGIEVTHACNMNCSHCAFSGGTRAPNEMSTEEIMELFEEWADMRVFKVILSGGEPFLREDLPDILNYGDELGLQQYVLTNASLITEEKLKQIPKSVRYGVSLDGFEMNHDKIRGEGSFRKTMHVLEMLLREGRKFAVNFTLSQINKEDAEGLMRYWLDRGVKMSLDPVLPFGRSSDQREKLWLTAEDAELFVRIRQLKIQRIKAQDRKKYGGPHPLHVDDMAELFHRAFLSCEGARTDVWVRFDGNVYPCADTAALGEFCMGNLREKSFGKIWVESETGKRFRFITKDSFTGCKMCDLSDVCNFRCAALSYSMHGDFSVCGSSDFIKQVLRIAKDMRITDPIFIEES